MKTTGSIARIAALLALGWAGLAPAAGGTCSLLNAPSVGFGGYSALGGVKDAEASILMSCLPTLPALTVSYTLKLGAGNAGSFFPRKMTSGGYSLNYNLFKDVSRSQVWGDGATGTQTVSGNCTAACSNQVYGRIPAGQSVPAASYSDSVLITVEF